MNKEIFAVKIPDIVSNKIILVGHGIEQLDKTFFHFKKVYSMIDKSLFSVEFRPHPNHKEELDYCNKYSLFMFGVDKIWRI